MAWFTGCILYVLIWWTALFVILPLGQEPAADPDPASGFRGVPRRPRLGRVVWRTTLLSAVIWLLCEALIRSELLSFRHGILAFHPV